MANQSRTDLRKTDFLVIRSKRDNSIVKIITPQHFQVGLAGDNAADTDFRTSMVVYGNINAASFIASNTYVTASQHVGARDGNFEYLTGSLTTLADGTAYLRAGTNISIDSGSVGSPTDYVTISATSLSNEPLIFNGSKGIESTLAQEGTYYNGTAPRELKVKLESNGGLAIKTFVDTGEGTIGGGLQLDLSNLPTGDPALNDLLLFGDNDGKGGYPPKFASISSVLSLGTSATLANKLTFGQGLQTDVQNATDDGRYDNSVPITVLIATASAGGLEIDADDSLKIKLDGSSLALSAAGISFNQLAGSLTQGTGISTFTYDGSGAATVAIDTSIVPRLAAPNNFSANNAFSGASTFSGNASFTGNVDVGVSAASGITGSLQEVSTGVPYLVAGSNVTLAYNTPAAGQIQIAASFGAGNTLSNGSGIKSFSYDGSASATIAMDATSLSTSGGRTSYVFLSNGGDTITKQLVSTLIDEVDRTAIMSEGTGIDITFSGNSNPAVIATKLDSSTLSTDGSGNITVDRVPNALTQGTGIKTFSFDGSSATSVIVDNSVVATLTGSQFSGDVGITGSLEVQKNAIFRGWTSLAGKTIAADLSGSLQSLPDGTSYLREGTQISIVTQSNGGILISYVPAGGGAGGGNSDKRASYLVLTPTGSLVNERVLNPGLGLTSTDSGAGQNYTLKILDSIVATLTGSVFSGPVTSPAFTGSLQMLSDGTTPYIIGTGSVSISTASSGQVVVSSSAGKIYSPGTGLRLSDDVFSIKDSIVATLTGSVFSGAVISPAFSGSLQMLSDGATRYLVGTGSVNVRTSSNGQVIVSSSAGKIYSAGTGLNLSEDVFSIKDSIVATLTGSVFSGNVVAPAFSGSLQMLNDGTTRYLAGTGSVSISTSSNGQVIVSASQGRVYSAGTGLKLADDTFSIKDSIVATLTGSQFSGNVGVTGSFEVEGDSVFRAGLSGSLQMLKDGSTPYIIGTGSVSVTTSSSGQLVISSSNTGGGSVSVAQAGQTAISGVSKFVFTSSIVTNDGGGQATIKPVIGAAEDGTYEDGLFTDFVYGTAIGTAVDRFNEVLLDLAPSPAPALDNVNSNDTGTAAYLSFGSSAPTSGYTDVGSSAGYGTAVDVNGLYEVATSNGNLRRAIFTGATVMDGTLNSDVPISQYDNGQLNYPQYSFGDADAGIIQLEVNGTVIHTASLSNASVGSGNPGSGTFISTGSNGSGFINLSQTGSAKQQDGSAFNTFKHRTGDWQVGVADQRDGWNYSRVTRVINDVTSSLTNYVEWVNDSNTDPLAASNNQITAVDAGGVKQLSGVSFFRSGTAEYRVDVSNAYKTCYDNTAITFTTTNLSISNIAKPTIDTGAGEDSAKVLSLTGSATITDETMLNGTVSAAVTVTHPLKANLTDGGSTSASGFLLWNVTETGTVTNETFTGETYRVQSGSFDNQTDVTGGSLDWDSSIHMSGSGGHADGLLVYNNKLVAPDEGLLSGDFRNTTDGGSLSFAPSGNPNYSGINSGTRTFYRKFQNTEGANRDSYKITLAGSTNITTAGGALGANNIKIFARLPDDGTGTSNTTGWLDCSTLFTSASYVDDSGCRVYTADTTVPANLYCTFGVKHIRNNDYLILKILADASWTGNISDINVNFDNSDATDASNLSTISSTDDGEDAKLSFGSSKAIPGFTDVVASAGVGDAVNVNGEYNDGDPNARRLGIFDKTSAIDGPLNTNSSTGGFGEGNCGTLKLEVNGSEIADAEIDLSALAGSGYPGSGATSVVNASGTGFKNISTTQPRTGSNHFPNFNYYFRTAKFNVAAADQRDGWNYVRAIHTVDGVDRTTTYVEWVNDPYTTAMSFSDIGFDDFGGSSVFYLSGVRYFDNSSSTVTGSLKAAVSGSHSNIYSKLNNAFSVTGMSNVSISQVIFSGSGYTYTTHNSDSTVPLPALDTSVSEGQSNDLLVTASFGCTLTNSLPADADSVTAKFRVYHPQKSNLLSPEQSKSTFLIYSASDSSSRNITENFSGELYRLISSSYDAKADITNASYVWNSQNDMNSVANYDDGLLIFDGKLYAPKSQGNSGDFRNVADGGLYQGPYGNVNYSSLTKTRRTYYRAFRNDTSSDVAQVMLQFTGSAEIIPSTGGFASGSIGANNMIHVDVKIPGKTAWLDLAKAGSGAGTFNVDLNGCLKGTPGQTINSNGAQTLCSFQGETANGTGGASVPAAASDFVLIRINADDDWTGNLDTIRVQWST